MAYKDVTKRRECHKRYYQRNKQLYKEKNIRRRKYLINFVNSHKDHPCFDCGIKYPPYVMDFDHKDPTTKLTNINRMIHVHNFSEEKILTEINKCDIVCANCHRVRTYSRALELSRSGH